MQYFKIGKFSKFVLHLDTFLIFIMFGVVFVLLHVRFIRCLDFVKQAFYNILLTPMLIGRHVMYVRTTQALRELFKIRQLNVKRKRIQFTIWTKMIEIYYNSF
jgi:hypothetical protein